MLKLSCGVLFTFLLALAASPVSATTWFVRPDGGTRYSAKVPSGQCDGKADTAYHGSGANQHCAFNDIRYMWMDGTYGNSAWVISGGDTVVIRGCHALKTQLNPDNPHCRIGWDKGTGNDSANFWCAGVGTYWGCSMPPPPSGTASQHTRILGACAYGTYSCNPVARYPYASNNLTQLFAGYAANAVMYLYGSRYVDLEGLEITTHNGQCTLVGNPAYPRNCNTSPPIDDFSRWGVLTNNKTSNLTLQDVYIHGFTNIGMGGPIGGPITLTRVVIAFNAFAGWNFDDGSSTPNAPGSSITQSYVTMIGNGCLEEYPIVHTQFPAKGCWDSTTNGFGDSWSGQDTELDGFSCDHCTIIYNTKDGAMGPHTRIKHLSLTNSRFEGNMGQQGKWGTTKNATTLIQNNLFVGNCFRMSESLPGAAHSFALNTKLPGAGLSNFCRASGDVFSYFSDVGSTVLFANNSLVSTSPTIFDLSCATAKSCSTVQYVFKNNIFLGYTASKSFFPFNGESPALFYKDDASVHIVSSNNIEYGIRNGDSCGRDIICSDPQLQNEPPQHGWNSQKFLDNFNFTPSGGSPANKHGTPVPGLTTDYRGNARPNPPSIGAIELGH